MAVRATTAPSSPPTSTTDSATTSTPMRARPSRRAPTASSGSIHASPDITRPSRIRSDSPAKTLGSLSRSTAVKGARSRVATCGELVAPGRGRWRPSRRPAVPASCTATPRPVASSSSAPRPRHACERAALEPVVVLLARDDLGGGGDHAGGGPGGPARDRRVADDDRVAPARETPRAGQAHDAPTDDQDRSRGARHTTSVGRPILGPLRYSWGGSALPRRTTR